MNLQCARKTKRKKMRRLIIHSITHTRTYIISFHQEFKFQKPTARGKCLGKHKSNSHDVYKLNIEGAYTFLYVYIHIRILTYILHIYITHKRPEKKVNPRNEIKKKIRKTFSWQRKTSKYAKCLYYIMLFIYVAYMRWLENV